MGRMKLGSIIVLSCMYVWYIQEAKRIRVVEKVGEMNRE